MEKTNVLAASAIPWMEDELWKVSTELPEIIAEETAIGTLIVIIISAIFSIALLFVMAVLIDCRHQKLTQAKQTSSIKRIFKIPQFMRASTKEDRSNLPDNIHTEDVSSSASEAVIV